MAMSRIYTVDSTIETLASTTQTCLLYGAAGAAVTADIQAIRVGIYSGASVSYPANGTVQFLLARTTGSRANGTALTPSPHNSTDIAANTTWFSNAGTPLSGLTIGATLWGQTLPFTAGANWAEWVTPGAEWRLPASGAVGVWVLCSSAGTATQFEIEAVFAE